MPSNPTRHQIYIELAHAYINLEDYQQGKKALDQAAKIYLSQRATHYSSIFENDLKDLQQQLNNLKQ